MHNKYRNVNATNSFVIWVLAWEQGLQRLVYLNRDKNWLLVHLVNFEIINDYICFADVEAPIEANCTCHRRCCDCSFVGSDAILGTCHNRKCTSPDRVSSFTNHCLLLLSVTNLARSEQMKRHDNHWLEWSFAGSSDFWAKLPARQYFNYWIRHTLVVR